MFCTCESSAKTVTKLVLSVSEIEMQCKIKIFVKELFYRKE